MTIQRKPKNYSLFFTKSLTMLIAGLDHPRFPVFIKEALHDLEWKDVCVLSCQTAINAINSLATSKSGFNINSLTNAEKRSLVISFVNLQHLFNTESNGSLSVYFDECGINVSSVQIGGLIDSFLHKQSFPLLEAERVKAARSCTIDDLNDMRLISVCRAA